MSLDLKPKIVAFLSENMDQKYTAREIAEWVFQTYPEACEERRKSSKATVRTLEDDHTLLSQIAMDIGGHCYLIQKNDAKLKITGKHLYRYYYTEKTDQDEIEEEESGNPSTSTPEHELYPILSHFLELEGEYNIYSKRIDERRSKNNRGKNGNKWLYPDLVAMEDLTANWHDKVKDCVQKYPDKKAKIWSFEVKLLINRSNVRETFFQAVSNSSWAHYGYLVAAELVDSAKRELQILSSLHGIGFILLDPKTSDKRRIVIPAKERTEIDWDTANRLVEENQDFKDFIEGVTDFCQTGRTKPSNWD